MEKEEGIKDWEEEVSKTGRKKKVSKTRRKKVSKTNLPP